MMQPSSVSNDMLRQAKRPTPTILSYAFSYARVATHTFHQKKTRKTRNELIMDQVNTARSSRITTEEIHAMGKVLHMSLWPSAACNNKLIYQRQTPAHPFAPTRLLASRFLSFATERSVDK
jgi:hypothetical protein